MAAAYSVCTVSGETAVGGKEAVPPRDGFFCKGAVALLEPGFCVCDAEAAEALEDSGAVVSWIDCGASPKGAALGAANPGEDNGRAGASGDEGALGDESDAGGTNLVSGAGRPSSLLGNGGAGDSKGTGDVALTFTGNRSIAHHPSAATSTPTNIHPNQPSILFPLRAICGLSIKDQSPPSKAWQ